MRKDEKNDKAQSGDGDNEFIPTVSGEGSVAEPDSGSMEQVGEQIGPYKLLKVLGEGGYGIVYLAEQQKPIKRRVALKVIKPGMDSKQVIARFEAERQTLALLDHPNIAHVFDAGTTRAGRPYFVMEYVKGISLTNHCDQEKLSIEQRLELFLQVCEAVHYAHQKGIIHRDIKPSNILVSIEADKALPKIIDFGVAKALTQPFTERTFFTEQGQLIGTPEYMSPEQAQMANEDIDTRSDIYSLGVLLYTLLTGALPFDRKSLQNAAFAEILRIIREENPPRPSTRISTLAGEESKKLAQCRRTDLNTLRRKVCGDLDWIVMKSLEKERARRYGTTAELAADIERHLNSEPVQAGPPTVSYRLRKFIRRHRVGALACLLVAVAVMAGLVMAMYGLREAVIQSNEAKRSLYFAHMVIARQNWEDGRVAGLQELLDAHRPRPREQDLRGWEWYYLRSLYDQSLLTLYGHTGAVHCVAWSPDGRYLASAGDDHTVRIWDWLNAKPISVLRGHTAQVRSVAWSPDGQRVASASDDETVKIWDWINKKIDLTLTGHEGPVHSVAWSPDGHQLASGGEDATVRVFVVETGEQFVCLRCDKAAAPVLSVAWSPDGHFIASGHIWWGVSNTDTFIVWDMGTLEHRHVRHQEGHGNTFSVAWSPDGQVVASTNLHLRIKLFDAVTGEKTAVLFDHKSEVTSASWSPNGQRLASAGHDQTVKIWDPATQEVIITLCGHRGPVYYVTWSPSAGLVASGGEDGTIRIWDATKTEEAFNSRRFGNWVSSVSWSPDGRLLATAPLNRIVHIWEPVIGQEVLTLRGHTNMVWCVAWSPDGRRLATASRDKTIRVWDAVSAQTLMILRGHQSDVKSVKFTPDGSRIVSVSKDNTIKVWDAKTGAELMTLEEYDAHVHSLAISPDGRRVASTSLDGNIRIWNVNTSNILLTLRKDGDKVTALTWSPDGKKLAASSNDGKITVWEIDSGRQILSIQGHTGIAHSIKWSPNGKRLVSGGDDGTVKIRDAATGVEVLTLPGHEAQVFSIAWSPNGQRLASAGFDNWVKVWDASPGYDLDSGFDMPAKQHVVLQDRVRALASFFHSRSNAASRGINRYAKAIDDYNVALRFNPDYLPALNDLAWLLATCPKAEFRDGTEAIKHAEKACELTGWNNYRYINTLAASYAEDGDFEAAIKWQKQAIRSIPDDKRPLLQRSHEYRLKQYESGNPYHEGIFGWWKFDGDATDSSGYGCNGKEVRNPIYGPGISDQALVLRGDGDYVLIPEFGAFLNGLNALTVCLWVKSNVIDTDNGFINFEEPSDHDIRGMRYDATGGRGSGTNLIKCGITSDETDGIRLGLQQLESSSNVQVTQWQHLAMTWSNTDQLRLYINGAEDSPMWCSPAVTGRLTGYTKLIIGKGGKDIGSDRSWNGLIDDVRIYNYALSEAEIKALYDESKTTPE